MRLITVSVIIPVYNMERHLGECLDSVFAQNLQNIEVICVDDGSTDATLSILENYQKQHTNLTVLNQNHLGAGVARNYGLSVAQGEFVAFMDSDDFYPNEVSLSRLYYAAKEHGTLVSGGSLATYKEGKTSQNFSKARGKLIFTQEGIVDFADFQFCYGFTRYIFNTTFLRKNGIVFPSYKRNEDPPFCLYALYKAEKFYAVPDTVYVARFTDKRIVYDNAMLCDIACGFRDMLSFSVEKHLSVLRNDFLIYRLEEFQERFSLSAYRGNIRLVHILSELDSLLREGSIQDSLDYERQCAKVFSSYKNIIIYGAGSKGRDLYDYITQTFPNTNVEFAVTEITDESYLVRKKHVHSLESLVNAKESALVVVSVLQEKMRKEMLETAKSLGFSNLLSLDKIPLSLLENVWGGVQPYSIISICRHSEPVGFALGETSPHYVPFYKEAA